MDKHFRHLNSGEQYVVARPFRDYDDCLYAEGDVIEFRGATYLPYHDGLSLFCVHNGQETQIRLQLRPESQQDIADNLEQYLVHYRN